MDHNHIDDDDTHQHPPRSRAPSSLWCGSAQGILLAALGCGLAVIYQAFVLGPHDERQIQRAFGGWARDQYEAWVLGEGSAAIDMQCDLLRLRASDVSAEAFERVYRGRRPLVLMGRGPGQGWTAAARRRGPWFMGEADGDAVWTLEGLRAVLEENGGEGQRLRVAEDGRELVRRGWWWDEDDDGAVESCSAEADTAAGVRRMALDAYLAMGASSSSQGDYYDEEEEEMEEQEEEGYLLDAAALRTHAGLRTSALGATLVAPPAPLALAFADDSTTTTAFLAVGRSRGGLPWHTLDAEAWIGSVAGGFTQYLLLPPGRGLRNVTMGRLGAGQTHPLLSPWEFVMRALPFLDHHGPEGPSSPSTTTTSSRADGDDAAAIQEDKVEEWEGDTPPLSCLLRPGDAVYLPGGGWKAMRLHIGDALLVGASRGPGAGGEAQQQQHRRRLEERCVLRGRRGLVGRCFI